jgi:hypothetical protein
MRKVCGPASDTDRYARDRLMDLMYKRGDEEDLRARADSGEGSAQDRLVDLLAERGDEEGLRARAERERQARREPTYKEEREGQRGRGGGNYRQRAFIVDRSGPSGDRLHP